MSDIDEILKACAVCAVCVNYKNSRASDVIDAQADLGAHHATIDALLRRLKEVEAGWRPIATHSKEYLPYVDLWIHIRPSPRSMGWGDSSRMADCFYLNGRWCRHYRGQIEQLHEEYITHWMPIPSEPEALASQGSGK